MCYKKLIDQQDVVTYEPADASAPIVIYDPATNMCQWGAGYVIVPDDQTTIFLGKHQWMKRMDDTCISLDLAQNKCNIGNNVLHQFIPSEYLCVNPKDLKNDISIENKDIQITNWTKQYLVNLNTMKCHQLSKKCNTGTLVLIAGKTWNNYYGPNLLSIVECQFNTLISLTNDNTEIYGTLRIDLLGKYEVDFQNLISVNLIYVPRCRRSLKNSEIYSDWGYFDSTILGGSCIQTGKPNQIYRVITNVVSYKNVHVWLNQKGWSSLFDLANNKCYSREQTATCSIVLPGTQTGLTVDGQLTELSCDCNNFFDSAQKTKFSYSPDEFEMTFGILGYEVFTEFCPNNDMLELDLKLDLLGNTCEYSTKDGNRRTGTIQGNTCDNGLDIIHLQNVNYEITSLPAGINSMFDYNRKLFIARGDCIQYTLYDFSTLTIVVMDINKQTNPTQIPMEKFITGEGISQLGKKPTTASSVLQIDLQTKICYQQSNNNIGQYNFDTGSCKQDENTFLDRKYNMADTLFINPKPGDVYSVIPIIQKCSETSSGKLCNLEIREYSPVLTLQETIAQLVNVDSEQIGTGNKTIQYEYICSCESNTISLHQDNQQQSDTQFTVYGKVDNNLYFSYKYGKCTEPVTIDIQTNKCQLWFDDTYKFTYSQLNSHCQDSTRGITVALKDLQNIQYQNQNMEFVIDAYTMTATQQTNSCSEKMNIYISSQNSPGTNPYEYKNILEMYKQTFNENMEFISLVPLNKFYLSGSFEDSISYFDLQMSVVDSKLKVLCFKDYEGEEADLKKGTCVKPSGVVSNTISHQRPDTYILASSFTAVVTRVINLYFRQCIYTATHSDFEVQTECEASPIRFSQYANDHKGGYVVDCTCSDQNGQIIYEKIEEITKDGKLGTLVAIGFREDMVKSNCSVDSQLKSLVRVDLVNSVCLINDFKMNLNSLYATCHINKTILPLGIYPYIISKWYSGSSMSTTDTALDLLSGKCIYKDKCEPAIYYSQIGTNKYVCEDRFQLLKTVDVSNLNILGSKPMQEHDNNSKWEIDLVGLTCQITSNSITTTYVFDKEKYLCVPSKFIFKTDKIIILSNLQVKTSINKVKSIPYFTTIEVIVNLESKRAYHKSTSNLEYIPTIYFDNRGKLVIESVYQNGLQMRIYKETSLEKVEIIGSKFIPDLCETKSKVTSEDMYNDVFILVSDNNSCYFLSTSEYETTEFIPYDPTKKIIQTLDVSNIPEKVFQSKDQCGSSLVASYPHIFSNVDFSQISPKSFMFDQRNKLCIKKDTDNTYLEQKTWYSNISGYDSQCSMQDDSIKTLVTYQNALMVNSPLTLEVYEKIDLIHLQNRTITPSYDNKFYNIDFMNAIGTSHSYMNTLELCLESSNYDKYNIEFVGLKQFLQSSGKEVFINLCTGKCMQIDGIQNLISSTLPKYSDLSNKQPRTIQIDGPEDNTTPIPLPALTPPETPAGSFECQFPGEPTTTYTMDQVELFGLNPKLTNPNIQVIHNTPVWIVKLNKDTICDNTIANDLAGHKCILLENALDFDDLVYYGYHASVTALDIDSNGYQYDRDTNVCDSFDQTIKLGNHQVAYIIDPTTTCTDMFIDAFSGLGIGVDHKIYIAMKSTNIFDASIQMVKESISSEIFEVDTTGFKNYAELGKTNPIIYKKAQIIAPMLYYQKYVDQNDGTIKDDSIICDIADHNAISCSNGKKFNPATGLNLDKFSTVDICRSEYSISGQLDYLKIKDLTAIIDHCSCECTFWEKGTTTLTTTKLIQMQGKKFECVDPQNQDSVILLSKGEVDEFFSDLKINCLAPNDTPPVKVFIISYQTTNCSIFQPENCMKCKDEFDNDGYIFRDKDSNNKPLTNPYCLDIYGKQYFYNDANTRFILTRYLTRSYLERINKKAIIDVKSGQCITDNNIEDMSLADVEDAIKLVNVNQILEATVKTTITCNSITMMLYEILFYGMEQKYCPSEPGALCLGDTFLDDTGCCQPCKSDCVTCSNDYSCDSCYTSSNLCAGQCPTIPNSQTFGSDLGHYFYNSSQATCFKCPALLNCADCSSDTNCSKCKEGDVLFENTNCISEQKCFSLGRFIDNGCEQCSDSCATCETMNTQCTSCKSNFMMEGTTCVAQCSTGFIAVGNKCEPCHIKCASCTGFSSSQCSSCSNDYVQSQVGDQIICQSNCPSGQLVQNSICTNCHASCAECYGNGNNECTACDQSGVLPKYMQGECLATCPTGQFDLNAYLISSQIVPRFGTNEYSQIIDSVSPLIANTLSYSSDVQTFSASIEQTCQTCSSDCATSCTGPQVQHCSDCNAPLLLSQGFGCVMDCSPINGKSFYKSSLTCVECPSNCVSCDSDISCQVCEDAYILSNGLCILESDCLEHKYIDYLNFNVPQCMECYSDCATCEAPTTGRDTYISCTSCKSFALRQGNCGGCSNGYYEIDLKCYPCGTTTCTGSQPNGSCQSQCKQCIDNSSSCTMCSDPNKKILRSNKSCVSTCPTQTRETTQSVYDVELQTYVDVIYCDTCPQYCKSCDANGCLSCNDNYILLGTQHKVCDSLTKCNSDNSVFWNFYQDTQTNECLPCSSNCQSCLIKSTKCQTCYPNSELILIEGTYDNLCVCKGEITCEFYSDFSGIQCQFDNTFNINWPKVEENAATWLDIPDPYTLQQSIDDLKQYFYDPDIIKTQEATSITAQRYVDALKDTYNLNPKYINILTLRKYTASYDMLLAQQLLTPRNTIAETSLNQFLSEDKPYDILKVLFRNDITEELGGATVSLSTAPNKKIVDIKFGETVTIPQGDYYLFLRTEALNVDQCEEYSAINNKIKVGMHPSRTYANLPFKQIQGSFNVPKCQNPDICIELFTFPLGKINGELTYDLVDITGCTTGTNIDPLKEQLKTILIDQKSERFKLVQGNNIKETLTKLDGCSVTLSVEGKTHITNAHIKNTQTFVFPLSTDDGEIEVLGITENSQYELEYSKDFELEFNLNLPSCGEAIDSIQLFKSNSFTKAEVTVHKDNDCTGSADLTIQIVDAPLIKIVKDTFTDTDVNSGICLRLNLQYTGYILKIFDININTIKRTPQFIQRIDQISHNINEDFNLKLYFKLDKRVDKALTEGSIECIQFLQPCKNIDFTITIDKDINLIEVNLLADSAQEGATYDLTIRVVDGNGLSESQTITLIPSTTEIKLKGEWESHQIRRGIMISGNQIVLRYKTYKGTPTSYSISMKGTDGLFTDINSNNNNVYVTTGFRMTVQSLQEGQEYKVCASEQESHVCMKFTTIAGISCNVDVVGDNTAEPFQLDIQCTGSEFMEYKCIHENTQKQRKMIYNWNRKESQEIYLPLVSHTETTTTLYIYARSMISNIQIIIVKQIEVQDGYDQIDVGTFLSNINELKQTIRRQKFAALEQKRDQIKLLSSDKKKQLRDSVKLEIENIQTMDKAEGMSFIVSLISLLHGDKTSVAADIKIWKDHVFSLVNVPLRRLVEGPIVNIDTTLSMQVYKDVLTALSDLLSIQAQAVVNEDDTAKTNNETQEVQKERLDAITNDVQESIDKAIAISGYVASEQATHTQQYGIVTLVTNSGNSEDGDLITLTEPTHAEYPEQPQQPQDEQTEIIEEPSIYIGLPTLSGVQQCITECEQSLDISLGGFCLMFVMPITPTIVSPVDFQAIGTGMIKYEILQAIPNVGSYDTIIHESGCSSLTMGLQMFTTKQQSENTIADYQIWRLATGEVEWTECTEEKKEGIDVICEKIEGKMQFKVPKGNTMYTLGFTETALTSDTTDRLYKGFILYVIILIDIFLVVGILLGIKCERQDKLREQQKDKIAQKESSQVLCTDYDVAYEHIEIDQPTPQIVVETVQGDLVNKEIDLPKFSSQNYSYCTSLKHYHRCLNLIYSTDHVIGRPQRAVSLSIQLMLFLSILGLLIMAIDLTSQVDAFVGFIITFMLLRLFNLILNSMLLYEKRIKILAKTVVWISLVLFYVSLHVLAIVTTLEMSDEDFNAWSIMFFIGLFIEIVIWEVIVTFWQHFAIAQVREKEIPNTASIVSPALMKVYSLA